MFLSQFAKVFLTYQTFVTNLHLLRVELRCKLQEKLHCVTGPLHFYHLLFGVFMKRDFMQHFVECTGKIS